jgi:NAD-dependent dihydropyrimidine dehydrogenase PreA subunit
MDVFRMDEKTDTAYVAYAEDCMVCYMCESDCGEGAIVLTSEVAEKMIFPFG